MSDLYKDLAHTSFPDSIDNIPSFENITAKDLSNVNMFHYYLNMGDFSNALNILERKENYDKKFIDSGKLNKFRDALIALERYYKTDIQPYITQKQSEWQTIMNQFTYIGAWSSSATYTKNNMVSYKSGDDTHIYIAYKNVPKGTSVTNTSYWTLLSLQGESGSSGDGGAFRYEYSSSTAYTKNDIVSYNNCLWSAAKNTTGVTPSTSNSANWTLLLEIPPVSAPLQSSQPTGQSSGDLWFQTI